MLDRAVHPAFGWAFIRAVTSDRRHVQSVCVELRRRIERVGVGRIVTYGYPSTFYRWRAQVLRFGPEILMPRERRRPKMANHTSPLIEQRVVAFALGRSTSFMYTSRKRASWRRARRRYCAV